MTDHDMTKAPVFVVLSTKGGMGKSLISQQILAPYLFKKFGAAELIEIDDENKDSAWMKESDITTRQVRLGSDSTEFSRAISSAIGLSKGGVVIDVGGNRTAGIVLRELSRMTSRARRIDAICIPVADNRMGVLNAEKTLSEIQGISKSALLKKCFIALNRVRNKDIVDPGDDRLTRRYSNVLSMAKRWKLPIVIVHDMDGVENLSPLGRTIQEISEHRDDLIAEIGEQLIKADLDGNTDQIVRLDDMEWAVNVAADEHRESVELAQDSISGVLEQLGQ